MPDSLYLALGRAYSSLTHLNMPVPSGAGDGEATLIAPTWVLTAAHVAVEIQPGHVVSVGGVAYSVDSVWIHPAWDEGEHDIALLRLDRPVTDVRPALVYRGSDEVGQVLVLVGYGDFGTGEGGPVGNDRQVRGATNRVDEATDYWIKMKFDPPGDRRTTPLEGVSGPGDSGGPAYASGGDREIVVGISSGQSSRAAGGPGRYGVTEYYTRVSRYVTWIEGVTGALPRQDSQ